MFVLVVLAGCTSSADPKDRRPRGDDDTEDTDLPDSDSDTDTDTDTDSDTDLPIGLNEHGVVTCGDPMARVDAPFVKATATGDFADAPWAGVGQGVAVGGGVAVADFDGDGLYDIVLPGDRGVRYYRGRSGGKWDHASGDVFPKGIAGEGGERSAGATPVDIDGDGDLDLYVSRFRRENLLLVNDGGVFSEEAVSRGLAGPLDARTVASSWADFDGDGDLDVFVASYGALTIPQPPGDPNGLYLNDGTGHFVDASDRLPVETVDDYTFLGTWIDLDDDRLPELYLVNDFGTKNPNAVLWNLGGSFTLGVDTGLELQQESMGIGVADLNGDETADFLVTAWNTMKLPTSVPTEPLWFDLHHVANIVHDPDTGRHVAWGAQFADLDHDADEDALVMFGHLAVQANKTNPLEQPDALYVRQPDGTFVQEAEAWGLDEPDASRGFVLVDLNADGWLDLVKRDLRGPSDILMAQCGAEAWLRVRLRNRGSLNRRGIGAKIRVTTGETSQVRWIMAGSTGFASGGPSEAHFGLADVDVIDRIDIEWPDGTDEVYENVPSRQLVTAIR